MRETVLVRQEIEIEGEVAQYSQLPSSKGRKGKHYKVNDLRFRGIYYSNGKFWCLRPDIYFNDEIKVKR